jgi:hypothetical protein
MSLSVGTIGLQEPQFSGITNGTTAFVDTVETPFGTNASFVTNYPNITSIQSGAASADLVTSITVWTDSAHVTLANAASVSHTTAFTLGKGVGGLNDPTNPTQFSTTLVDAVLAGDAIIFNISFDITMTIVGVPFDSNGNKYVLATSGSLGGFQKQNLYVAAGCVPAAAGTNKITVTFGQKIVGGTEIWAMPVHGADPFSPVVTANTNSGNGTAMSSSTYSTQYKNTIAAAFTQVAHSVSAGQAGYTVSPQTPFGNIAEYQVFSSVQTGTATTATQSSAGNWIMSTVVLRQATPAIRAAMRPAGL